MAIYDQPVDPAHLPKVDGTTSDPLAVGVHGKNEKGGITVLGASVGMGWGFSAGPDQNLNSMLAFTAKAISKG